MTAPEMPTADSVYDFLVADFDATWRAKVSVAKAEWETDGTEPAGGNFFFALLAMILLEHICVSAQGTGTFERFCEKLDERNALYLRELPGEYDGYPKKFDLPTLAGLNKQKLLIAILFQLLRNGHAHKYHQRSLELSDGNTFGISVFGANHGAPDDPGSDAENRALHLTEKGTQDATDVWLRFFPDVFFSDVVWAAEQAGVYGSADFVFQPFRENPLPYDGAALRAALNASGATT